MAQSKASVSIAVAAAVRLMSLLLGVTKMLVFVRPRIDRLDRGSDPPRGPIAIGKKREDLDVRGAVRGSIFAADRRRQGMRVTLFGSHLGLHPLISHLVHLHGGHFP